MLRGDERPVTQRASGRIVTPRQLREEEIMCVVPVCVCVMSKYIHTAVCEGNGVGVAGQTLLLTVVGAGGRSHSITAVDVVRVDGLPTWSIPGKDLNKNTGNAEKNKTDHEVIDMLVKMHL